MSSPESLRIQTKPDQMIIVFRTQFNSWFCRITDFYFLYGQQPFNHIYVILANKVMMMTTFCPLFQSINERRVQAAATVRSRSRFHFFHLPFFSRWITESSKWPQNSPSVRSANWTLWLHPPARFFFSNSHLLTWHIVHGIWKAALQSLWARGCS